MPVPASFMSSAMGGAAGSDAWKFFGEMLYSNILEEFYPKLLLHDMGQHIVVPGHQGKTVHVRAWTKTNPVSELTMYDRAGVKQPSGATDEEYNSPASQSMDLTEYMGTIHGFGGSFAFTDIHMAISEVVETLTVGARQLGGGYAVTVEDEALKRILDTADGVAALDGVKAGEVPIKFGSNGSAWGATVSTDYLTVSDIFRVGTEFEADPDGMTYAFPDGYYRGIIHPRVKHDLFTYVTANQPNLVGWIQTSRGQGFYEGGKIPVLDNIAIETSAHNTTNPFASHAAFTQAAFPTQMGGTTPGATGSGFANTHKGYMSLFFAPGAFSNLDLANATPSLIIQPFGSSGALDDPLKRLMTVGIKGYQTWVTHQVDKRLVMVATGSSTTP